MTASKSRPGYIVLRESIYLPCTSVAPCLTPSKNWCSLIMHLPKLLNTFRTPQGQSKGLGKKLQTQNIHTGQSQPRYNGGTWVEGREECRRRGLLGHSFLFNFTVNLKFPENLNWKIFLLVLNTTQPEQLNSEDLPAFLYEATYLMMGKRASYR